MFAVCVFWVHTSICQGKSERTRMTRGMGKLTEWNVLEAPNADGLVDVADGKQNYTDDRRLQDQRKPWQNRNNNSWKDQQRTEKNFFSLFALHSSGSISDLRDVFSEYNTVISPAPQHPAPLHNLADVAISVRKLVSGWMKYENSCLEQDWMPMSRF